MPRDDVDEEMGGGSASDEVKDEVTGGLTLSAAVSALLLCS